MTDLREMFPDGWAAASFALREVAAHPALPSWTLVAQPGRRTHPAWEGITSVDRAAQRGMLQAAFSRLPEPQQVFLAAYCGPAPLRTMGRQWLGRIFEPAIGNGYASRMLVERYFGRRVHMRRLAEDTGMHRNTLSRRYQTLRDRLDALSSQVGASLEAIMDGGADGYDEGGAA